MSDFRSHPIMSRVQQSLTSSSDLDKRVIWTVATTACFGFFRLGKLIPADFNVATGLAWGDVAVDNCQDPRMAEKVQDTPVWSSSMSSLA